MYCFLSVNRVKLMLSKGCIIRTLHYIVKFSITLLLSISLWIKISITKLRMLALKHESIVYSVLFREIILIVEVPETILLILTLHLLNLPYQIGYLLFFSVLLVDTILINLNIITWLRKSIRSRGFFWIFDFWKMLRKIIEKLIIVCLIFILHLGSSSSELLIRRIVAFCRKICDSAAMWKAQLKAIRCQAGECQLCSRYMASWSLSKPLHSHQCFLDRVLTLYSASILLSPGEHSPRLSKRFLRGGFGQGLDLKSSYIGTHIFPSLTYWICCTVLMELL